MKRIIGVDIFRGLAIVLMIIFHFCYDLNYFKFTNIPLYSSSFWLNFRLVIVNMFLITAGISLVLANPRGINYKGVKKRVLLLGLAATVITVVTYFIFPTTWVYFGVIHFILIASVVGLLFINRPFISLILAIIILIAHFFYNFNMHPLFNLLAKPLHLPIYHTEDLVPFIPWFSATLIGISMASFGWHKVIFDNKFFNNKNRVNHFLSIAGKHSLLIYLIHQPIIFGILSLVNLIIF